MNKSEKEQAVQVLEENFKNSNAVWLTQYRGLTVAEIKALRDDLRQDATYSVVKNTLATIAAKNAEVDSSFYELLSGPSAIAFVTGDASKSAKAIKNFAKDNEALEIVGGIMDGKFLTPEEVKSLAELPSKEELIGTVINSLLSPVSEIVSGLSGNLHGLLDGIEAKAK
jgi:large subunit ribosomal protein L10